MLVSCTVGYGYFHPSEDSSKIFTIFMILIGLTVIYNIMSSIGTKVLTESQEGVIQGFHRLLFRSDLSPSRIRLYKFHSSLLAVGLLLLIGTLFYSGNEGWSLLDGVYWTVCTMTTVGYGKYTQLVYPILFN